MRAPAAVVAWTLAALAVGAMLLVIPVLAIPHAQPLSIETSGNSPFTPIASLAFSVVGALIVARRPRHAIGWVYCASGTLIALSALSTAYGQVATAVPGALPLGDLMNVVSGFAFFGGFVPPITVGLLLFPDGRLLSPRWTIVAVAAALGVASLLVSSGLEGRSGYEAAGEASNTLGVGLLVPAVLASVASLVLRWRWSHGVEREQLKWVGAAAALLAIDVLAVIALETFDPDVGRTGGVTFAMLTLGIALIPVSIGIAILRYRLYDIDLLINRTLVYGALTALLAAAYVGGIVLFQALLRPITSGSEIAVTASTLAVTLLFGPLRSRIQHAVDRRFYRRRYDAAATVDAFALRLRDSVDLDALTGELLTVVGDTVQPAHASVWLRERAG